MAVGDWHEINGYRFQETEFGPNVAHICVDCGASCYATPECKDPRCLDCARKFRGVLVVSVKPARARFLRGAPGLAGDRAYTVDELALASARRDYASGGLCVRCGQRMDPVIKQEGYDCHAGCDLDE